MSESTTPQAPEPDLAKLRELAKKATPVHDGWVKINRDVFAFEKLPDGGEGHTFIADAANNALADFIAAANPQAILALIDRLAETERDRAAEEAERRETYAQAKRIEAERDSLAARLTAAEARLAGAERVVAAARATYENDDVWTLAADDGHGKRDKALGAALAAYDALPTDAGQQMGEGDGHGT